MRNGGREEECGSRGGVGGEEEGGGKGGGGGTGRRGDNKKEGAVPRSFMGEVLRVPAYLTRREEEERGRAIRGDSGKTRRREEDLK